MRIIDISNVSFAFDKGQPILENISLSQEEGTLRFITGPSGSGKTTLLQLLLGIHLPDEGEIWVNGCSLKQLSHQQLTTYRQHIGVVFQANNLVMHRSVFENVAMPLWIRGYPKPVIQDLVESTLLEHDLQQMSAVMPPKLSSGEQQRVAIARALISKPHILVADEPTGNLDNELSQFVVNRFRREAAEGRTVMLVTHDDRLLDTESDLVSYLVPASSESGASSFV